MYIKELLSAIKNLPEHFDAWINDDFQPDEITIDFNSENVTLVVKGLDWGGEK